jgi:hypothetical protein
MTSLKAGERAYIANAVKKKDRIEGQRSRVAITEFTVVRVTEKGVWLQQEGHPKPKYITMASNLAHATKTAALNALIGAEHRKWAVLANMQQEHIRTMEDARLLIEYEGVKHRRSENVTNQCALV